MVFSQEYAELKERVKKLEERTENSEFSPKALETIAYWIAQADHWKKKFEEREASWADYRRRHRTLDEYDIDLLLDEIRIRFHQL